MMFLGGGKKNTEKPPSEMPQDSSPGTATPQTASPSKYWRFQHSHSGQHHNTSQQPRLRALLSRRKQDRAQQHWLRNSVGRLSAGKESPRSQRPSLLTQLRLDSTGHLHHLVCEVAWEDVFFSCYYLAIISDFCCAFTSQVCSGCFILKCCQMPSSVPVSDFPPGSSCSVQLDVASLRFHQK